MNYHFWNINIKKNALYDLILVLMAILILIIHYPQIYGEEAFGIIWMANALRNGALISENSWLISPMSYFGYYPYSNIPIGIPFILAFLISLLNLLSFGIFGIPEAILVLDIILIIIIYKSAKNLGNTLFKEEWCRFIFVAAVLFSQYVLESVVMTVNTKIIITILMMLLLNLSLKILNNSINKNKAIILLFLFFFIGFLSDRIWFATITTIILLFFTYFIQKFKKLQHLSVFLILSTAIFAFFYSLESFKEWNNLYISGSSPIAIVLFFSDYYGFSLGLFTFLAPIGILIVSYNLTYSFKKPLEKNSHLDDYHKKNVTENYYILLFIIPLSLMLINPIYSKSLFFPILVIFSVKALISIKKLISNFSKKLDWVLPIIFLSLFIGYNIIKLQTILSINLWNVFLLSFISLITFLFILIINNYNRLNLSRLSQIRSNIFKLKKELWIGTLTISILMFSFTYMEVSIFYQTRSSYPWENRNLTNQEIEIIEFFQEENIDGLIFVFDNNISERIGGFGFLPCFSKPTNLGISLYYSLINPNTLSNNTQFSLSAWYNFNFFKFNDADPIATLRDCISVLDLGDLDDFNALLSYNVQYIITANETFLPGGVNDWLLIKTLQESDFIFSTQPIFSTKHLLVWKIY